MKDYYHILGITKEASAEEIKKSYRKAALQYHPDRTDEPEAEIKFKEAAEAYGVLSDPTKKAQYDSGQRLGVGANFWSAESIFSQFFGGGPRRHTGNNIRVEVEITFMEAAKGCTKSVTLDRKKVCGKCRGIGAKGFKSCAVCGGTGHKSMRLDSFILSRQCEVCGGLGQISEGDCTDCNGNGYTAVEKEIVEIKIPAGIDNGMKLRIQGRGDPGENGIPPGHLYVFIRVLEDDYFEREGPNLLCIVPLTYTQFVLGTKAIAVGIDAQYSFTVPPGTQPGAKFSLWGLGLPYLNRSGKGDLIAITELDLPDAISSEYKEVLDKLKQVEQKYQSQLQKNYSSRVSL